MRSNYKSGLSLKPIIFGVLAGVVCCFVMISLVCFLFLKSKSLPEEFFEYLSLVILAVSSFVSGFAAGFTAKRQGLVYGFFCGIFLFVLFVVGSLAVSSDGVSYLSALKGSLAVVSSLAGGILGVNKAWKNYHLLLTGGFSFI